MQDLYAIVSKVADKDVNGLITGDADMSFNPVEIYVMLFDKVQ